MIADISGINYFSMLQNVITNEKVYFSGSYIKFINIPFESNSYNEFFLRLIMLVDRIMSGNRRWKSGHYCKVLMLDNYVILSIGG